ncbi:hypothetical protein QNO08_01015 [Arthrobacter sp. zg-Y820]|uniref:hypothetical protein n=1 Tax=unclassified Arthrobacter TaxID=235627 RepID=UPI001E4B4CCD|nr:MULTISPECIES: hypothetical protein [unclassified Arthrobacter]MCC9197563.1 hypothetical protein [Arthrobacter sp. zg-Y820]MDK1280430.1 hypothetical protein [Arthrobacter sp. zg.Y820]WIB09706.1 hypothetical protein QNO08_01015 [Arthrobacter sp. zg-Y820]
MSDEKQQPTSGPARRRHSVLGALDRLAFGFFGPPEREASPRPVIHRHDSLEAEIDNQLQAINVETDEEGHHYGVRRIEAKPVTPNPGVIYPYYSGRPPLNAPET